MPIATGVYAQTKLKAITKLGDPETAKRNWMLLSIDEEDHPGFIDACELCNARPLRRNFTLSHADTGAVIRVGSQCVKTFIWLRGATSQEDSNALFDLVAKESEISRPLRQLMLEIMVDPVDGKALDRFRHLAAEFFGLRGVTELTRAQSMPEKWKRLLAVVNPDARPSITERARVALFDSTRMNVKRSRRVPKEYVPELWRRKTMRGAGKLPKRVVTTLARSEAYRDPQKKRPDGAD